VRVAAAVLAAGHGARLAGDVPKPLTLLRDRPLVTWALDAVRATELSPVVLVVGRNGSMVAAAAPAAVMVVHAARWHEGIAHSLRAALDAIEPYAEVDAVCVGLADQPLVGPEAYRRLAAAHQTGATLAVATYDGVRQNPVLLARELWDEARTLRGDVGARALMVAHETTEVDCTGTGSPVDVDTIEDLHALEDMLRRQKEG
jgi:molybdenum cofactor cytidylyltransferase/nicotine blue oxidoreductase